MSTPLSNDVLMACSCGKYLLQREALYTFLMRRDGRGVATISRKGCGDYLQEGVWQLSAGRGVATVCRKGCDNYL